ncbi:class I SAM-dependent methyltransferase [Natronolimnohabitans innermongolicus]|uniref:Type 11 methyltransferase n=1 Tax=Natronolimnohabitans innermongolicus JCM 12255 TaxID=1227499 RepID=L9X098_9EURY|nr:class I SAM-dependent methyltransferase [Natronolimnohabitans innermongolicus]ELY54013.1 type 11 methyltransferase [Natronolimnohabitans innermongolicus JCM 12255]
MTVVDPFESDPDEYDAWFDANADAYRAERVALERALPADYRRSRTVEIGAGTGRFAEPLGISLGVDPARSALVRARERDIESVQGVAESLPVADDAVDLALFVTVFAFVDDLEATLAETRRVLAEDGALVVAVLDRSSPVGRVYQEQKDENPFYADATFLTAAEARSALEDAGFTIERRLQTVFDDPSAVEEPDVREGHGDGLFAVTRARPDR